MLKPLKKAPPSAIAGLIIVLFYVGVAIFAPVVSPYSETEIVGKVWEPIGGNFILGTDNLGRDLLSRIFYGARNTISIALITTILSFSIGIVGGFFAATMGRWVDMTLSRVVDIMMAIPTLIFALMILSILGTDTVVLILVIAILDSTRVYRLSRAVAMDIEVMDYVEVVRLQGEGLWYIMRHEILPNALPPLVAEFGLRFCFVFLFISALSFLGLGLQPPTADWGSMVRDNANAISFGIPTALIPATAIAVLTIGVNLVVDWFLLTTSGLKDEH